MKRKTYFLVGSIQNIIQNQVSIYKDENETLKLQIYSLQSDLADKHKCEGVESFTGQSWIATESYDEAIETFERWLREYSSSKGIDIEFEEINAIESGILTNEEIKQM